MASALALQRYIVGSIYRKPRCNELVEKQPIESLSGYSTFDEPFTDTLAGLKDFHHCFCTLVA